MIRAFARAVRRKTGHEIVPILDSTGMRIVPVLQTHSSSAKLGCMPFSFLYDESSGFVYIDIGTNCNTC